MGLHTVFLDAGKAGVVSGTTCTGPLEFAASGIQPRSGAIRRRSWAPFYNTLLGSLWQELRQGFDVQLNASVRASARLHMKVITGDTPVHAVVHLVHDRCAPNNRKWSQGCLPLQAGACR